MAYSWNIVPWLISLHLHKGIILFFRLYQVITVFERKLLLSRFIDRMEGFRNQYTCRFRITAFPCLILKLRHREYYRIRYWLLLYYVSHITVIIFFISISCLLGHIVHFLVLVNGANPDLIRKVPILYILVIIIDDINGLIYYFLILNTKALLGWLQKRAKGL